MGKTVLVTGGAGFIGSHVTDELLRAGYAVRVLDSLCARIHGARAERPEHLHDDVDLRVGDLRDPKHVRAALEGVDLCVHLAASTSIDHAASVNVLGTSVLLGVLARADVERLVVASSMSVYGEGRYVSDDGVVHDDVVRTFARLESGAWDAVGPGNVRLWPVATQEDKPLRPIGPYAVTKRDQELMCLAAGRHRRRPTVALRVFAAYGPYMSATNPYSGMLMGFASRVLAGKVPTVLEDGGQLRDFVHARDVARAFRLALEAPNVDGHAINVATGHAETVNGAAALMGEALGEPIEPEISGRWRGGEARHCMAHVGKAERLLGFRAEVGLDEGLRDLARWIGERPAERKEPVRREIHGPIPLEAK
jgi:dTDP-L-rhamnose 4-epimerase